MTSVEVTKKGGKNNPAGHISTPNRCTAPVVNHKSIELRRVPRAEYSGWPVHPQKTYWEVGRAAMSGRVDSEPSKHYGIVGAMEIDDGFQC